MAPATTPRPPGSLTVPVLFGWQHIVTALLLLIAVAVICAVLGAAGSNARGRAEWQAFLDARSHGGEGPSTDPRDETAEPIRARVVSEAGPAKDRGQDAEGGAWPSLADGSTNPVR